MNNLKNATKEQLNEELRHDHDADKELDDTNIYKYIEEVMKNIEDLRKKRKGELEKVNGETKLYSQKALAEKSGIAYSTYKNYISGLSNDISLETLLKIAVILRCDLQDILP